MTAPSQLTCADERLNVSALEDALGYVFQDAALLRLALTHRSYSHEKSLVTDNQRVEFLGDAVLGFLLADRVFRGYTAHPEGMLTILRASIASGAALAEKARQLDLGATLLLGNGERATGGADRDSNLTDALEAVLGAVYLDGGLPAVSDVFDRLFTEDLAGLQDDPWHDNPKGKLQTIAQRDYHVQPAYTIIQETGPVHRKRFRSCVSVGEALQAEGCGVTKRAAQTAAAAALLKQMEDE